MGATNVMMPTLRQKLSPWFGTGVVALDTTENKRRKR
jgi:hypothetical protein